MKKYLLLLGVLVTLIMSACSNDDIEISEKTYVRINPATVVKNFTYQLNAGDLDGVSKDHDIIIRLYIYDETGKLHSNYEDKLANYLSSTIFEINLESGVKYTAVAISDVEYNGNEKNKIKKYWEVSGEETLSTLRVSYLTKDLSCFGPQEILGVSTIQLISGEEATINLEAAGAMICTWAKGFFSYPWANAMMVMTDRTNDFFSFENGVLKANPDIDEHNVLGFFAQDEAGTYCYKFIMPLTNVNILMGITDNNGELMGIDITEVSELERGKEYLYQVEFAPQNNPDGIAVTWADVSGKTYGSRGSDLNEINTEMKELPSMKSMESVDSWRVLDLVK